MTFADSREANEDAIKLIQDDKNILVMGRLIYTATRKTFRLISVRAAQLSSYFLRDATFITSTEFDYL